MNKNIKTAIIILNYNDRENTIKYTNEIKSYEIIDKIVIVDNLSTIQDEFEELEKLQNLNADKIDVIKSNKNGGYAYGNNFGLKYIEEKYSDEFEYVIISNPDVSIKEDNIINTIKFLEENEKASIAAPRMKFLNGLARRSSWKKRTYWIDFAGCTRTTQFLLYPIFKSGEYTKKDFEKEVLKVDNIAGSFFIAKLELFKEIGYFDENTFLFFEEDIIGDKISKKGYEIYSLNNLEFMHYESKCIGKLYNIFKKQDMLFDSRIYYHKTYNNINKIQVLMLKFLKLLRKLELVFEISILKLLKK